MVDVTIDDLLDGENIRKRGSVGPFNQEGITYKGSVPPNAPREIHVTNQAQLEAELGVDLEIPDGQSLKIIADESFTLSKGFKYGVNSTLLFVGSVPDVFITYTGSDPLHQNSFSIDLVYTGNFLDNSNEGTSGVLTTISSDGLTLFTIDSLVNLMFQYDLSTPNDLSTAVYSGKSFDFKVGTNENLPEGLCLSSDDSKFYIVGSSQDAIFEYDLPTLNDITTASYSGNSLSTSAQDGSPRGLDISNDGTKLFLVGGATNFIYQYNLSVPKDLSTAVFSGKTLDTSNEDGNEEGVAISSDGRILLFLGNASNTVYQYNLSTPNDLSTAVYSGISFDIGDQTTAPMDIDISSDNSKAFIIESDTTFEYDLTGIGIANSSITKDLTLIGNGTNKVYDLTGTGIVTVRDVNFIGFGDMGEIKTNFSDLRNCGFFDNAEGLKFIGGAAHAATNCFIQQTIAANVTYFSVIAGAFPIVAAISRVRTFLADSGDTLVFIDPNSPVGSAFTVDISGSAAADFYQQGVDIAVTSVVDAIGDAEFNTGISHDLVPGKPVVLSGFTETTYNGTFIVKTVDTDITGTTFTVIDVAFFGTDTGTLNAKSLDSTDVEITATSNTGVPNSMYTADAGLELFGSEISSSSLAQDAFEVITSASWSFNNLERFEIGVNNEGQLVAQDTELRRYTINYTGTIEKSGGGSVDIGIVLLKNGVIIGFNAPHTVNTGKIQIGTGDIVQLTAGDTIQVAVINYDVSATAIDISQVSLVVNRA